MSESRNVGIGEFATQTDDTSRNVGIGQVELVGGGAGGGIEEAPKDGKQYARKNGAWSEVEGGAGGEVFYAKYDETTYDEVKAAYDAGRTVVAYMDVIHAGRETRKFYVLRRHSPNPKLFEFENVDVSNSMMELVTLDGLSTSSSQWTSMPDYYVSSTDLGNILPHTLIQGPMTMGWAKDVNGANYYYHQMGVDPTKLTTGAKLEIVLTLTQNNSKQQGTAPKTTVHVPYTIGGHSSSFIANFMLNPQVITSYVVLASDRLYGKLFFINNILCVQLINESSTDTASSTAAAKMAQSAYGGADTSMPSNLHLASIVLEEIRTRV